MTKKKLHDELTFIASLHKKSTDKQYSKDVESINYDCSSGCKFFLPLDGEIGYDWGVCGNRVSPRAGVLTFEHTGCSYFECGSKLGET